MRFKLCMASLLAASVAAGSATAAQAAEEQRPGWELSAYTEPTNLLPASEDHDEVQEVTAESGATTFTLRFGSVETASISATASAAAVQTALEALPSIGAGNVKVSSSEAGVYTVTFEQLLGNTQVTLLEGTGATEALLEKGAASGTIAIEVFNVGAAASSGGVTVTDVLPAGLKAKEAGALGRPNGLDFGVDPTITQGVWNCTGNGPGAAPSIAGATIVSCADPEGFSGGGGQPTFEAGAANPQPVVGITVEAASAASGLTSRASVGGGGALESASTEDPIKISAEPAEAGIAQADAWFSNANGTTDVQAGSHPYTATFVLNLATALNADREAYTPGGELRDLEVQVPPGLIGDLHNVTQCSRRALGEVRCPPASIVGRASVPTLLAGVLDPLVFNLTPQPGEPAELGIELQDVDTYITFTVQSGGKYGIVAHVNGLAQRQVTQTTLTLWGVPEAESHDPWRSESEGGCSQQQINEPVLNSTENVEYCARQQAAVAKAFLTLPTACGEPEPFIFRQLGDWQNSAITSKWESDYHDSTGQPIGFIGCEALVMEPAVTASLDTSSGDSPSGLAVDVKPALGGLEEPGALASADIQDATVTLPLGFAVNPGQAAGLTACGPVEDALTTQAERENGEENDGPASCPASSKVGTVVIQSPLIAADGEKQFEGNVYILQSNPPDIKLLVAASADGVNVKLVGTAHLTEKGQLVTSFDSTPELPFSDLKFSFAGGAKAALVTPAYCGAYALDASFTPWTAPLAPNFLQSASLNITEDCSSGPLPFAPQMSAGSANDQAGGFTSFTLRLRREDDQQRIGKVEFRAPNGLAAMIANVPLCEEPLAEEGRCPTVSRIGHAVVAAGPSTSSLTIPQPGEPEAAIYLTGPYNGAPFGLTIVTPVIVGPFNLGPIVTRAAIQVNPRTAQVTITTDQLPQVIKGVPTDLRELTAVIEHPGFVFNPTNCETQEASGTVEGAPAPGGSEANASASVATRFAVGSCRALGFEPKVSISLAGHASKENGASLAFKIAYPKGAVGAQAWFRGAKFVIPKQLPSRLETLQQACDSATFAADRVHCPQHSIIGHAVVHTPVLPVPLEGPVYFVSKRGEEFPEVVMVLTGDNVTVELVGETLIRKGVTSATFRGLPDVPFESVEVKLPTGPYSEFAANLPARDRYDFCGTKISIPEALMAQNGLEIHKNIAVGVSGCSKAHPKTKKKHRRHT